MRLDSSIQVQLAAQMHQLGMHELAEAVLARARRRAGNNTDALLGLMSQYQRQGKTDTAVQIAHQILRRSESSSSSHSADFDYPAQQQAIQVLARSGKLNEIIARLEGQLQLSPESLQLHQSLAAYYRAAGQRDKLKVITEGMVNIRPEDGRIRMQVAAELAKSGDTAAAVGHIRAALKKDPKLYGPYRVEIHNAFLRQNKIEELLSVLEEIGPRAVGDPYIFASMVVALLQNPAMTEPAMAHWRKLREAYPGQAERLMLLTDYTYVEELWIRPELYDDVRQVLIPEAAATRVEPWFGFEERTVGRFSPDGRILNLTSRLLEAATRRDRLDELAGQVEEAVCRLPNWMGGKALLGLIRVRQHRFDEGKRLLEASALDPTVKPPLLALLLVGQELREVPPMQPLARAVYERVLKRDDRGRYAAMGFEHSPIKHLATLSRQTGRTVEARSLLLQAVDDLRTGSGATNPNLAVNRKITSLLGIATALLDVGCPSDALSVYGEVLGGTNDLEELRSMPRRGDLDVLKQAREGVNRALHGLNRETLGTTLRAIVPPPDGEKRSRAERVDLVLAVHPGASIRRR